MIRRLLRSRVSLVFAIALATCAAGFAVAAAAEPAVKIDFGEPAPLWLRESQSYAIGYDPAGWDALAQSKVKFITHCPINREFFERCHALGVRCFPYVTFYQGYASQTYMGVNLKDHRDFIEIDAQGNLTRTGFWESEDAKNMYTTCPNVAAYQDAMLAWVEKILQLGADGVFIDNISSRGPCFGPKFGKHRHLHDDQNHAFAMLLKRTRELIKRYKPEGALIVNSASPLGIPTEYWKYIDADMLESYICTWVSKERWFDWKTHWHEQGVKLRPFIAAGKQVQALSYVGHTPYGDKEDSFFCYATARLAGFVWNGGLPLSNPDAAPLYRLDLGPPLAEEIEENGVYWRPFSRGLVAVNPDRVKPGAIRVRPPIPSKIFYDFFGDGADGWARSGAGGYTTDEKVRRNGRRSIRCENSVATAESGASQTVVLDQEKPTPIRFGGASKAENVSGSPDGNYAVYLDIMFRDGTPLYGQVVPFDCGTHDWQHRTVTLTPEKPIKSLTYNVLFRYKSGRVWFDDMTLEPLALAEGKASAESTKPRAESTKPRELLVNGSFEAGARQGRIIDATATGRIDVPAYSGRVFLYGAGGGDDLVKPGPTLRIVTRPPLGEVRFRVDGFDYWTHSGSWTTEYTLGPNFGTFSIVLDRPGKHTIEVVDVVPADMKTAAGYSSGQRLGQFMDPSNPTKPSAGRKFHFRQWTPAANTPAANTPATDSQGTNAARLEINVARDTTVTAEFDVQQGKK